MTFKRDRGDRFIVEGGAVLEGCVSVSGAKNAALAMMCAALLTDEDVTLANVPDISDVDSLGELLLELGVTLDRTPGDTIRLNAAGVERLEAPASRIAENRASFQVTGPLLARFGEASAPAPGGDSIGQRPIAVHLAGFEALGARVTRDGQRYTVRAGDARNRGSSRAAGRLRGARVFMDYASVTGTQNVMMAAVLAEGHTTIVNAATEPEVQEIARLLNCMGARIEGIGAQVVEIDGVERLHGASWRVMPDRIEAGTYAIAAAITGGDVLLDDAPVAYMDAVVAKLRAAGAEVRQEGEARLRVNGCSEMQPLSFQALPYPGVPTDIQAPLATMLTQAHGQSVVHERVFDDRLLYISELRKMGADIVGQGSVAYINGPSRLHGTRVRALDIRAGVAVLLAALVAEGTTIVEDIYHLDRGYAHLEEKLRALGADLKRD